MGKLSLILSIISLLFIAYISIKFYFISKKKKNISWDVKQGIRCYSCKSVIIEETNFHILSKIYERYSLDTKKEYFELCISCNRDDKLEKITTHDFFNGNKINKLKRFLYSRKSDKVQIIMLLLMIVFHVIDGLIRNYFNIHTMIGSLYTILYWHIWYYRITLTYE